MSRRDPILRPAVCLIGACFVVLALTPAAVAGEQAPDESATTQPAAADEGSAPEPAPAAEAAPAAAEAPAEEAAREPAAVADPEPVIDLDAPVLLDGEEEDAGSADEGDLIVLDGGPAQVALYGVVHGLVGLYTGSDNLIADGDPMEQMGFRLRRARLGFKGWAFGVFDFMISVGADDLEIDLEDAWIGYRQFSVLGATLGNHKVPFSRYALTSSTRQALIERPLSVEAMAPGRQMGLSLEGEVGDGLASYALGVFNGFERHTNFHEGYVENPATNGNRFTRVAVAGRVSLEPLGSMGRDIADLDGGGLRIGVGSSLYYNDGDTTRTVGWEADVALKIHGFHFLAEYLADSSEPTTRPTTTSTIPAKQDRFGLIGEVGYMILPAQLGLAFRTEWFDDDESQDNNGDQVVITGGVQYYWHRHHFKASLDFTHRTELHGSTRDNDSLLLSAHFTL